MQMDLADLLLDTRDKGASDLHLTSGSPPAQRLHGKIMPMPLPELDRDTVHEMVYGLLTDDQKKKLERDMELDFALEFGDEVRFRANVYVNRRGEGAVFRVIPTKIMTLDDLKMPKILKDLCKLPRGLILVTGPTGSGKSTTLAAMVNHINEGTDQHILTIEDPIEFVHPHKKSLVNQREVGPHTHSFANALRSSLREDPDVILVGELRDLETISLALTAAETGHLVFATLHTSSAPKTVDRLVDVFPPTQQEQVRIMLAESLQAVVCQTLVPRRDGRGRVCAMEVMTGTVAIRSLIRESKTHQIPSIIQVSAKYGMQSLDQMLKQFMMEGLISREDAMERANNKFVFAESGQEDPTFAAMGSSGGAAGGGGGGGNQLSRPPQPDRQTQPSPASTPTGNTSSNTETSSDTDEDWMQIYGKKQ